MKSTTVIRGKDNCDKHGEYEFTAYQSGTSIVGKRCPICLREAHERARAYNEEQEIKKAEDNRIAKLKRSGVPYIFHNSTLSNYDVSSEESVAVLKYAKGYSNKFDLVLKGSPATGIIMCGISGTGKTHISCGIIAKLLEDGYSAMYESIPALLLKINEAMYGRCEQTATQVIDNLTRPHLLVLDEYGSHTRKDEYYQSLFGIVEKRYQRGLPTILVTNMTFEELKLDLDARFLERVLGNKYGSVLTLPWETHRLSKG